MENETEKNINDLLAMTDFSMNKLFGEPKKEIESPEQFADRIFRQSGLAEKFDQLDLQIKNIKNTLRETLADCHQTGRTAPNSEDNTKEVVPLHPTEEGTAIERICHMCGMQGATVSYSFTDIMTHPGKCTEDFLKKEIVPPHLTGEGTAICHVCGRSGATQKRGIFWTHDGRCDEEFQRNEEKATNDFENNFSQ